MSKKNEETQLTIANDFDVNRIVFQDPQAGSVPDSNPPITFKRIYLKVLNEDGSMGDLILPTGRVFSFGVSENISQETGKVNGHVLPLCLWNRDGATKDQKKWVETFDNIVDHCKDHLLEHREEIEKYDLERADLKKLNPLYWKMEKGKRIEGLGPTLYAKLIASRKQNKILSMFFDVNNESMDPLSLKGRYCHVEAAVKIESIFIGNKISFQVKLYEAANVEVSQYGMTPLISRPNAKQGLIANRKSTTIDGPDSDSDNDSEVNSEGSIDGDDEKPKTKPKSKPKLKIKKRNLKKVT